MQDIKIFLEQYLRLELNREDLLKHLGDRKYNDSSDLVCVTIADLMRVIQAALENQLNKKDLSLWIDFIWFSGYYDYRDNDQEAISQIMNDLEDVEQLTDDQYRDLLNRINIDIAQGKYPRKEK